MRKRKRRFNEEQESITAVRALLPELGTKETAIRGCASLIAGMCGQPERVVHIWLDTYYQLRLAYEVEKWQTRREREDAAHRLDVFKETMRRLTEEAAAQDADEAPAAETKEEQKPVAERSATPPPCRAGERAGRL